MIFIAICIPHLRKSPPSLPEAITPLIREKAALRDEEKALAINAEIKLPTPVGGNAFCPVSRTYDPRHHESIFNVLIQF